MKSRGRPAKIGKAEIIQAALEVGLPDLSMKLVAKQLGVGMSTLYYHISGIEELIDLVADEHVGAVDPLILDEDETSLEDTLIKVGERLRAAFLEIPGFASAARQSARLSEGVMASHEAALTRLEDYGLKGRQAFLIVRLLADYVEASTERDELWSNSIKSVKKDNQKRAKKSGFERMEAALKELPDSYLEDQFRTGLRILVKGIVAELDNGSN